MSTLANYSTFHKIKEGDIIEVEFEYVINSDTLKNTANLKVSERGDVIKTRGLHMLQLIVQPLESGAKLSSRTLHKDIAFHLELYLDAYILETYYYDLFRQNLIKSTITVQERN